MMLTLPPRLEQARLPHAMPTMAGQLAVTPPAFTFGDGEPWVACARVARSCNVPVVSTDQTGSTGALILVVSRQVGPIAVTGRGRRLRAVSATHHP
jgi:hypothetical protein